MNIMSFIKKQIPSSIKTILAPYYNKIKYRYLYKRYKNTEASLRTKKEIKVAFFATFASVWKFEYLYRLMEQSSLFKPIIVVCPVVNYGTENMIQTMEECFNRFSTNYNCVKSYDKKTGEYLDVRKVINPDIIFFTSPYRELVDSRYFIDKFLDKLTCYVSYGYNESNLYNMFYNLEIHNLVWRLYAETPFHQEFSKNTAFNKGINVQVTGYPGIDVFLDNKYQPNDVWKIKDNSIKRIIWAPHHTFHPKEPLHYSCFLEFYNLIPKLAEKYQDKIQFAFKPHPLLRIKLEKYWGKEKTDQYYKKWEDMPNGMFVNGDYVDLFLTSDAMIHESGSFIAEYLYTLKPVMHTTTTDNVYDEFNEFGKACLSVYYHGRNNDDIEKFILNVINGKDELKEKRYNFYNEYLLPPNHKYASENILNDIIKAIR